MNLKWTKSQPKIDGLYWYFDSKYHFVRIREIKFNEINEVNICYLGTEIYDTKFPKDGYWMGPIEEPERPVYENKK